jgi:hypothetical protein
VAQGGACNRSQIATRPTRIPGSGYIEGKASCKAGFADNSVLVDHVHFRTDTYLTFSDPPDCVLEFGATHLHASSG